MNVVDIMTEDPKTISPQATLYQAIQLMEDNNFMHLPVLSRQKHLVGVISDRDCRRAINSPYILRERWQDDELINQLVVRSVMSPAPIIIEPYAPATEAARLMLTHNIGCLPVMRAETLIGIVTRSDILAAFMRMYSKIEALSALAETANRNGHVK
jgi:acetoin utilization protein AcuB